jgi:hypothetical protein
MRRYAGVGSRETPQEICDKFRRFSKIFAEAGWCLRSGGADGADLAFESGAIKKEIFLPWRGFNGSTSPLFKILPEATDYAERVHAAWDWLTPEGKLMQARNVHQVLGADLRSPCEFVLCWTKNGRAIGGTATAINVAWSEGIPVHNVGSADAMKFLDGFLDREVERLELLEKIRAKIDLRPEINHLSLEAR